MKCQIVWCETGGGEGGKQPGPGFLEEAKATLGWMVDRTKPQYSGVWPASSRRAWGRHEGRYTAMARAEMVLE